MSKIHLHDGFHKENDVMLTAHAAHFKPFFFGSFRDTVLSAVDHFRKKENSFFAENYYLNKIVNFVSP
jgi:delta-aminolevulinic acid dehydratase/porphobilinogen synthase